MPQHTRGGGRSLWPWRWALLGLSPLMLATPLIGGVEGHWWVREAKVAYEVSHLLHGAVGRSDDVRGAVDCRAQRCTFRLSAPLRSFDSGDADRDRDMLAVTRANRFPEAVVEGTARLVADDQAVVEGRIHLAGAQAELAPVRFEVDAGWWRVQVRGSLPVSLQALSIEPPALLGIPISDTIRVYIDLTLAAE